MSAEILRRAAALMRERAEATVTIYSGTGDEVPWHSEGVLAVDWDAEDAAHIASWSPDVALAVADWLDAVATRAEQVLDTLLGSSSELRARVVENNVPGYREALAVARAYLGESA